MLVPKQNPVSMKDNHLYIYWRALNKWSFTSMSMKLTEKSKQEKSELAIKMPI